MNYYIDFDNTLFDTPKLTDKMLQTIAEKSGMDILEECKKMFNREHIFNIYKLIKYFSEKYHLNEIAITDAVNNVINNSKDFVFEDSIEFIKNLKENGHKVYMLSYYEHELQYQIAKISGSHLADLFDQIIITKEPKYELNIDYSKGIFIDDKPSDLIGLYSKNPIKVIRLKRKSNKYSSENIHNANIEEYENFYQINN